MILKVVVQISGGIWVCMHYREERRINEGVDIPPEEFTLTGVDITIDKLDWMCRSGLRLPRRKTTPLYTVRRNVNFKHIRLSHKDDRIESHPILTILQPNNDSVWAEVKVKQRLQLLERDQTSTRGIAFTKGAWLVTSKPRLISRVLQWRTTENQIRGPKRISGGRESQ